MKKTKQKGVCQKKRQFFGSITVTDKGQIAIPIELRRELKIETGDRLVVLKRRDGSGINLIKPDCLDKFIQKMSGD